MFQGLRNDNLFSFHAVRIGGLGGEMPDRDHLLRHEILKQHHHGGAISQFQTQTRIVDGIILINVWIDIRLHEPRPRIYGPGQPTGLSPANAIGFLFSAPGASVGRPPCQALGVTGSQ